MASPGATFYKKTRTASAPKLTGRVDVDTISQELQRHAAQTPALAIAVAISPIQHAADRRDRLSAPIAGEEGPSAGRAQA